MQSKVGGAKAAKKTSNTYKSIVKMDDYNVDRGRRVPPFVKKLVSVSSTTRLQDGRTSLRKKQEGIRGLDGRYFRRIFGRLIVAHRVWLTYR